MILKEGRNMKYSKFLLVASSAFLLCGCSLFNPKPYSSSSTTSSSTSGTSSTSHTSSTPAGTKKHTILIYMCGSNLESGYNGYTTDVDEAGLATANLNEILSVSGLGNDVNVVIETGGAKAWAKNNSGITPSASKLTRYHVANGKLVQDAQLSKASMAEASTLSSFVEWGLKTYPAERTGLLLWNHGGAMMGCCSDENYNDDMLSVSDLTSGVSSGMSAAGVSEKLEWIGYDCCLMGVADIAASNSKNFKYMVSSQESEPGEGWDYDVWLKNFVNYPTRDTESLLTPICDSYITKVGETYNDYGYPYKGHNDGTLSVLDLSKVNNWISEFDKVCGKIKSSFTNKSALNSLLTGPMQFGWNYEDDYDVTKGYYPYGVFDAQGVLKNMKSKYSADISAATAALNELIIYNKVGVDFTGTACGLCIYAKSNCEYTLTSHFASGLTNWKTLNSVYSSGYLTCTTTYMGWES